MQSFIKIPKTELTQTLKIEENIVFKRHFLSCFGCCFSQIPTFLFIRDVKVGIPPIPKASCENSELVVEVIFSNCKVMEKIMELKKKVMLT